MTMTNTLSKTIIEGVCFIIPNGISKAKEHNLKSRYKAFQEGLVEDDTLMVEIWCSDSDVYGDDGEVRDGLSDNWSCHGIGRIAFEKVQKANPGMDDDRRKFLIPHHFPVSIFDNKCEGDIVEIEMYNCIFKLKLSQLNHRYRNYGSFENCLNDMKLYSKLYN